MFTKKAKFLAVLVASVLVLGATSFVVVPRLNPCNQKFDPNEIRLVVINNDPEEIAVKITLGWLDLLHRSEGFAERNPVPKFQVISVSEDQYNGTGDDEKLRACYQSPVVIDILGGHDELTGIHDVSIHFLTDDTIPYFHSFAIGTLIDRNVDFSKQIVPMDYLASYVDEGADIPFFLRLYAGVKAYNDGKFEESVKWLTLAEEARSHNWGGMLDKPLAVADKYLAMAQQKLDRAS